ncbi:MAG: polyprenyl synthetase family protein [Chloroflexi bacterium]|nr:polyprenyl synthetase family protein [Chloroflexota bacterium]
MNNNLQQSMLEAIEKELQHQVARLDQPRSRQFHEMLTYHMGWTGEGAGSHAAGKRIRPLLTLLVVVASNSSGGDDAYWLRAVSSAAAIELIHNFSLVHDDIQDNSVMRRGRSTVWAKWGAPMAINVGDALFVIANQAILDLAKYYPAEIVVKAAGILNENCLDLTRGQYLDMSYEKRKDLSVDDYWPMIGGKTSALLSSCTHIGALLGYANESKQESYRLFGYHLGRAFQVQDDILGIWGDETVTGKSAASDLVEGKNSLPILFALEKNGEFAKRWREGPITGKDVLKVSALLEDEGARDYAEKMSEVETQKALGYLKQADPRGEAGETMLGLANKLLKRNQ